MRRWSILLLLAGSGAAHAQEVSPSPCAEMTRAAPFADLSPEQVLVLYNSRTPEERKAVYPPEQVMPELSA